MSDITNVEKFTKALESERGKDTLELGKKIKKLDKDTDKRLKLTTALSLISMTVLGYYAFSAYGAIIFFGITAISSFALVLSSKKNILLKYLAFYRSKIPELIAQADNVSVKTEAIPCSEFISSIYPDGKLSYRMCHNYDGLYIAYAKFMQGNEPLLQGLLYYSTGNNIEEQKIHGMFTEHFDECVIKIDNEKVLAFIPGIEDYLNGRVGMKNDLTNESLSKQYEYYTIGKKFKALLCDQ